MPHSTWNNNIYISEIAHNRPRFPSSLCFVMISKDRHDLSSKSPLLRYTYQPKAKRG